MKIAALDLGTNSFLCLIAEKNKSSDFRVLQDEMEIVRLGQGLGNSKRIHADALKRADDCLKKFSDLMKSHGVKQNQAVATAAARDAENSEDFFKICNKHGIPVVMLTGDEEAAMSFQGAVSPTEEKQILLIDIGGGSTEYIVGKNGQIELGESLSYGAVKLTERWIPSQPVSDSAEEKLRNFIRQETEPLWQSIQDLNPEKILAVAGTPTALATAIMGGEFNAEKIEGFVLTRKLISSWVAELKKSSIEEKKLKFGFGNRSDVIFAGTIILDELLNRLKINQIQVSTKGIRYGLAYQMFNATF